MVICNGKLHNKTFNLGNVANCLSRLPIWAIQEQTQALSDLLKIVQEIFIVSILETQFFNENNALTMMVLHPVVRSLHKSFISRCYV